MSSPSHAFCLDVVRALIVGGALVACSSAPVQERPQGNGGSSGSGSGFGGTSGSGPSTGGGAGVGGASGSVGAGGVGGGVSSGGAGPGGTGGGTGGPNTAPGFQNLAPPMGAPLDPQGATALTPAAPTGWGWYPIDGAICRDGSPMGIFVHFTSSDKLYLYFEGGGACTNLGFCNFNPANVNKVISGDGQTVIGSALGVIDGRQQPGVFEAGVVHGIFDTASAANPFKDWNGVYVPYCTGDVHSGTRTNATVPGVTATQQFVGHVNVQKILGRVVPTFKDKVNRVIVTGASAGSYGAALNFSMIQDSFGEVLVDALLDSGPPFSDQYMPVCMQKRWRETWGLNDALPPDCTGCRNADGGNLTTALSQFLMQKHPNSRIALISSMQDEIIRLFFAMGLNSCANFDTADPVAIGITLGAGLFPAADYTAGLNELRTTYASTGRFATYFLGGLNITYHQHEWRARFIDATAGTVTIAQFTTDFLNGQMTQIGP
jgi:hypothetical protein